MDAALFKIVVIIGTLFGNSVGVIGYFETDKKNYSFEECLEALGPKANDVQAVLQPGLRIVDAQCVPALWQLEDKEAMLR